MKQENRINYFLPRANKIAGQNKLDFRGAKLRNKINGKLKVQAFQKNLIKDKEEQNLS